MLRGKALTAPAHREAGCVAHGIVRRTLRAEKKPRSSRNGLQR
jgi:hypothetical protein